MRRLLCIEHSEPIMMLCREDKVLSPRVGDQVNPGLCIPVLRGEVGKEVVVDNIRSIRIQVIVVHIGFVGISMMSVPPVPFRIDLNWRRVALKL